MKADIIIFGAGIAGLWTFNRLKREGYDVLLLEKKAIGGGQSISSQGIIHSGLKYAFGGKISELARNISAMPDLWREALQGRGSVDLSKAKTAADSQYLLLPKGMMGGLVKLVTKKALGNKVEEVDAPESVSGSGFQGSVIFMDEPVLDIPSAVRALAEPYKDSIRKYKSCEIEKDGEKIKSVTINSKKIEAQIFIFTGAAANENFAKQSGHKGFETQKRPLLMAMMKNAPFDLWAHMVGTSDKPVATITTHQTSKGERVWYIGGSVAERAKEANPQEAYAAAQAAFAKYLPQADISKAQWAVLPIDRVEGKSSTQGFLPDTPTLHIVENAFYGWPTKLTFAPLLSDMIFDKLKNVKPSGKTTDWSFLPAAEYAKTPWDEAQWTSLSKESSAKRG